MSIENKENMVRNLLPLYTACRPRANTLEVSDWFLCVYMARYAKK